MNLLDQIKEVMSDFSGPAHVSEISEMLVQRFPNIQIPLDKLPVKITSVLSTDVKKKGTKASFTKVKNKTGGYKKGIYKLKRQVVIKPKPSQPPPVSSQYTGKAGETAVISELLFYGFNASAMAVDDGIDVIAGKNNKFFHIQVKTANASDSGNFGYTIKKSSFTSKDSSQTFYIFVVREQEKHRFNNDFIIMPSNQIRQLVEVGIIKDGSSLSVRIHKDNRGRYLLNAKQDITISANTFSQIS